MVSINYAFKEIISKIVYYGPGLSGKTTNLQYVFKEIPSATRGELISLATDADRTLYFDFLPVNVGKIQGFATKFQLYTVPGQVYYNATRKLVLRGVDGLVFVADSQASKMDENIESLQNLKDNLEEYGYDIDQISMVIQYNKRDLPDIVSIDQLESILNPAGLPYFEATAVTGEGVFKTLKAICKMVLDQLKSKKMEPARQTKPQPVEAREPVSVGAAVAQPRAPEKPPARVPNGLSEAAVEVPATPVRSTDRISTPNVERAVISEPEVPANVVVSDAVDERRSAREEHVEQEVVEERTERATMEGDGTDSGYKEKYDVGHLPLTNDYSDFERKQPERPSGFTHAHDYNFSGSGDYSSDVPEINLKANLPLKKPQMAESRKVKGKKKKFGLFGLFR